MSSYEISVMLSDLSHNWNDLTNFRKWLISEFMNSHAVVGELFNVCGWTDAHDRLNRYGAWIVNVPKKKEFDRNL